MGHAAWAIEIDGKIHHVALRWSIWRRFRELTIDGETVRFPWWPDQWSSAETTDLAGHPCHVETRLQWTPRPTIDAILTVSGRVLHPSPQTQHLVTQIDGESAS